MEDISKVAWSWLGVLAAIFLLGALANYAPKLWGVALTFLS